MSALEEREASRAAVRRLERELSAARAQVRDLEAALEAARRGATELRERAEGGARTRAVRRVAHSMRALALAHALGGWRRSTQLADAAARAAAAADARAAREIRKEMESARASHRAAIERERSSVAELKEDAAEAARAAEARADAHRRELEAARQAERTIARNAKTTHSSLTALRSRFRMVRGVARARRRAASAQTRPLARRAGCRAHIRDGDSVRARPRPPPRTRAAPTSVDPPDRVPVRALQVWPGQRTRASLNRRAILQSCDSDVRAARRNATRCK